MGRPVVANNESGGFHGLIFDFIKKHKKDIKSVSMIMEPLDVIPVIEKEFPGASVNVISYREDDSRKFDIDLCIHQQFESKYDVVISQALLEHTCRPSIVVENLLDLCNVGGIVCIHTHLPGFGYHPWPYDCLRFFRDFWISLSSYLEFDLVDYAEAKEGHMIACLLKHF